MIKPKFTIIIPTRERCDVLRHALRSATAQSYDNLEILVSDNFSGDETRDVVEAAGDERVRYVNTGSRVSMSHNWEFALSHVDEGWVTFMGDDDGLLADTIASVADTAASTGMPAIRTRFCTYDWPGVGASKGRLIVPLTRGVSIREARPWLSNVMQGKKRYSHLPMIYNGGFVQKAVLDEVKSKAGSVFLSASPDISTAISISRIIERYAHVDDPLAVSGTSRHSNGYAHFSTNGPRDVRPAEQFSREDNIPYHDDVPLFPDGSYPLSLHAGVYEAYLQSSVLGGNAPDINRQRQLEIIIATAGRHRKSVLEWGHIFAQKHGLDYSDAVRSSRWVRYRLQSMHWVEKTMTALNSVITESLPISNVHEAGVAASVIRSSPGRSDTARFLTDRALALLRRNSSRDPST